MKDEDVLEITNVMSNMAKKLLAGEEINKKKITVELDVWEPLVIVIERIAANLNVEPSEALGQLAQEGLNMYLTKELNQVKQEETKVETPAETKVEDIIPQNIGVDLDGVLGKLGQLQEVAAQLQNMQKMLEGVEIGNFSGSEVVDVSNKKNNQ